MRRAWFVSVVVLSTFLAGIEGADAVALIALGVIVSWATLTYRRLV